MNNRSLAALLVTVALCAGCSRSDSGAAAPKTKALHLAFVTNNAADFWAIARKGTEQAEKEIENVKVNFLIPSDGTAAEQKRIIDDLLAKGVDGIAISPVDPANQTQIINESAKQALIFTQDSDAPQSDRACYLGTDNHAAGLQAGALLRQALPAGGKIMVFVGKTDAQNAHDRLEGIKDAIKGTNLSIIDVRTDNTDRVRAKANVVDTLVNNPDVAGLVGLWSYNGPAILNATRESGKLGQVKIVCFDEEDETLAGVKEGAIFATVVQQPFEFGRQAIGKMAGYLRGDKSIVPADKKIIVPTLQITKAEVDAFTAKMNGLRGRAAAAK